MKSIIAFIVLFFSVVILVSSTFAQTPSFNVVWKQGIIMGLIVPPNTTKEQLKDLIYKLRQAKKDNNLSNLLPPITPGAPDKYSMFILYVFSDSKWATLEEYTKYERAGVKTAKGRAISRAYLNHIMASYEYDIDGKEYGAFGYDEGGDRSVHYKKLF